MLDKMSNSVADLTGEGHEFLVVDGIIIAAFYNGNFAESAQPVSDVSEPTLIAA